jgi:predicted phage tail protein
MSAAGQQPPGRPPHHGIASLARDHENASTSTRNRTRRSMSVTDLADDDGGTWFNRALQWVPRILSSKPHIVWLMALGVYLIVLPLLGIAVSAKSELIGGNYTNVTSDIGACIAAGGTLHLVSQGRKRQKVDAERLTLLKEVHALLHHLHPEAAAEIRQAIRQSQDD